MRSAKRAICFDLGNTLVHGRKGFTTRLKAALGISNDVVAPLLDQYFFTSRLPAHIAISSFCECLGIDCSTALIERLLTSPSERLKLYEDVLPVLSSLTNYRLAILSNVTSWETTDLASLGLAKLFECIVYSFEIGIAKPARAAFAAIEHRLDLSADQLVMVGDSWYRDIQGAKYSGWSAILLERAGTISNEDGYLKVPDVRIQSLRELPAALDFLMDTERADKGRVES